jgi:hypothetical protein
MSFKEQFNQQLNNMISGTNEKKRQTQFNVKRKVRTNFK